MTNAFNLFDFGLKKAEKVQLFDENSLDSEGKNIPFETQHAIVSHYYIMKAQRMKYLQVDGTKHHRTMVVTS